MFSQALLNLRHRFPIHKWQVGEGMFCGSKYVQDKATKEIMITQTEFAAEIVKIPMSAARKKMREDVADEAEIHAFRGVSGSVNWLAGQNRPDVSCQVSQVQHSSTANNCTSLRVKHGGSQSSSASRFGSQDQASSRAKHDIVVACRRLVEHRWSCWLTKRIHLWCYRSVIAGWKKCSMVSTRIF